MYKPELQGFTINDKYTVGPALGAGAFGEVYIVYDIQQEKLYALKKEEQKIKIPQLLTEYRILKMLEGTKGFPTAYYYGFQLRSNVCIMDLLGPSLQDLLQICEGVFSLKTVLMLAQDIIDRIQVLHSKGYLYRDIKPQNFVMGLQKNSHKLYLIDFGLCKRYKDSKNNQHFMYKEKKNAVGTLRYASINSHLGIQYSRRDDLEAIGYLLIYLATGDLPWKGVAAQNKTKRGEKILQMKLQFPVETYTQGLPSEFCTYMRYCRALKFSERPDYDFVKRLFSDLFKNVGYTKDYEYDWCRCQKSEFKNNQVRIEINKKEGVEEKSESDDNSVYNVYGNNRRDSSEIYEEEIKLGISSNSRLRKSQHSNPYNEGDQNIDPDLLDDSQMRLISKRSKWFESTL